MKSLLPKNDNACPLMNRRTILKGGAGSLLAVLGCNRGVSPPSGPVSGGNVADVAVNTLRVLNSEDVVLGRDDGGLYAMSAACTHAGCLLSTAGKTPAQGLSCPCHASRFDGNGNVTRGPANVPLQHYRVDVAADGAITIQGGMLVSSDTRTSVG